MDKFEKIARGELIGVRIKIEDSKNKSIIGLQGKIIDETKNMLKIETNKGKKTIIKDQVKINFIDYNQIIDGKILKKRPEERIKMNLKSQGI